MTSRNVRIFAKYQDFNEATTLKASLASLCVNLKSVIDAYEEADLEIRGLMISTETKDVRTLKEEVQVAREKRKTKTRKVIDEVYKKRNERDPDTILEVFKTSSDLFKNITDEPLNTEFEEEKNEQLERLKSDLELTESKLQETNERLDEANEAGDQWKAEVSRLKGVIKKIDEKIIDKNDDGQAKIDIKIPELVVQSSTTIQEKRGTKLDNKTPSFRSKQDEDVEVWLYKMESALECAGWEKSAWLKQTTSYVEGTAYEILRATRAANLSWDDFKVKVTKTFKAAYKDFRLRGKFLAVKDSGNFEKYLHDFQYLSNQISPTQIADQDRMDVFVRGLRPKTQSEMFMRNITTLDDAILTASTLENLRPGPRLNDVNFVKINKPSFDKRSHVKNFQGKCNKCHKIGHKEKDCYVRIKSSTPSMNYRPINNGNKKDISQIECLKCHKKGHYSSRCGKLSSTAVNPRRPMFQSNVVEVNIIEIIEPKASTSIYCEENHTMESNWRNYDNFILRWCIHKNLDFCHDCLSINDKLNRLIDYPQTCIKHLYNFKNFEETLDFSGVVWDNQLHIERYRKQFDNVEEENSIFGGNLKFLIKMKEIREMWWLNYDKFVLEWCMANEKQDFCYGCDDINRNLDRRVKRPGVCSLHQKHQDWGVIKQNWETISNRQAKLERKNRERLVKSKTLIENHLNHVKNGLTELNLNNGWADVSKSEVNNNCTDTFSLNF